MIALAAAGAALTPASSGQSPGTQAPACKPASKPARRPLAKGITIYASPNPLTAGGPVRVFGQLIGIRRGVKRCGIAIVLWRRFPAQRAFSPVAHTRTLAGGRLQLRDCRPRSVTTNRDWVATARGLRSRVLAEQVRPLVTLVSTATFAVAGDAETLSGKLAPGLAGEQVRSSAAWVRAGSPSPGPGSSADATFSALAHLHDRAHRAVAGDGPDHPPATSGSASPVLKIRIAPATGIHKIRHVVVIMQENRSFDSYFGTYPGADGIPAGVCVPDPANGGCVAPFHDPADLNNGGPHGMGNAIADIDSGRMDGFVAQAEKGMRLQLARPELQPVHRGQPSQSPNRRCIDVMGYHDAREIPNYWAYARELRAPGPHVRAQRVLEPARAPVHGVRVVGLLHATRWTRPPATATSRTPTRTRPSRPAPSRPRTTASCTTPGPT